MRPLARTLVALIGVLASMEGEALATPKPRRPPSAQPAPKPKRRPPPVATPAPAAEADEAQRVRESADAATPPTVDVVTGPPTAPKAVGPIALDPERAKPPPIAAAAPERAKGTSGPEEPSAFTPPRTMWPVYAAGVVARRKDGLFSFYALADKDVLKLCDLVCGRLEKETTQRRKALGR